MSSFRILYQNTKKKKTNPIGLQFNYVLYRELLKLLFVPLFNPKYLFYIYYIKYLYVSDISLAFLLYRLSLFSIQLAFFAPLSLYIYNFEICLKFQLYVSNVIIK